MKYPFNRFRLKYIIILILCICAYCFSNFDKSDFSIKRYIDNELLIDQIVNSQMYIDYKDIDVSKSTDYMENQSCIKTKRVNEHILISDYNFGKIYILIGGTKLIMKQLVIEENLVSEKISDTCLYNIIKKGKYLVDIIDTFKNKPIETATLWRDENSVWITEYSWFLETNISKDIKSSFEDINRELNSNYIKINDVDEYGKYQIRFNIVNDSGYISGIKLDKIL